MFGFIKLFFVAIVEIAQGKRPVPDLRPYWLALIRNPWPFVKWWLITGFVFAVLFSLVTYVPFAGYALGRYATPGGVAFMALAGLPGFFIVWLTSPGFIILSVFFLPAAILWLVVGLPMMALRFALIPINMLIKAPVEIAGTVNESLELQDKINAQTRKMQLTLGVYGGARHTLDGKARLMDADEFAALKASPQRGGAVRVGKVDGEWFDYATEKHLLVVASTRGGKGRDLIIPNLNLYPGSVFCLDPKGENAARTHEKRREFGPVQVLDPFGVSGLAGSRFNPLVLLAGDMQITNAQMLADALVQGEEDHWTSSARGLLTGLLLHVATAPDIETRDLPTVRGLLMRDLLKTLEAMTQNEAGPQEVRDVGEWGLKAASEEWASIVSSAVEQTKWLASPQIQEVLKSGGQQVDFDRFRDSVQSVFVCLPAPYFSTFSKWLRLVVAASLDTLTKELNPDMPNPTRFVLDEVAQLGYLEKIESALTLSAGYGVQLWGIWQHLRDIERCYKKSGISGWVSSSGLRLVFATQDNESVRYFADMSGEAMSEADIRHMGPGQMICLMDGQNPLIVDRVPGPG